MLGKTNITTLSEGGIVTEIEDFRWIQGQSGIRSDFVKAIFQNGYLAAITADGAIVYSTDGEVWEVVRPDAEGCKLNDIDWDGRRFLLVGSSTEEGGTASGKKGLIMSTADFKTLVKISDLPYNEFFSIFPQNGKYSVVAQKGDAIYSLFTDLTEDGTQETELEIKGKYFQYSTAAKSTNGVLVCIRSYEYGFGSMAGIVSNYIDIVKVNGSSVRKLLTSTGTRNPNIISVFECKDILYLMYLQDTDNYKFNKITGSDEIMTVCMGQNFAFKDGVYFNGCQIFINNHEMMVVRKEENIADKTLGDFIEIAPEATMNCIIRAFGQLFIFGNQGVILKSSAETNNEEAIAVQALSAKKALADAKRYTDEQFAVLEARIAALEGAAE